MRLGTDSSRIQHDDAQFPWSTLIINIVGSFVLGLLVARLWPAARAWLRALLGAGLLGSFTTFSAFAVSLVTMTRAADPLVALAYLLASVAAGIGAAALGLRTGRRPEPIRADE